MKKTKMSKRIIVSTLSTVMATSLVGAITGTVAWYQYSTRSTVSFIGTTVSSSENLVLSLDGENYTNDIHHNQFTDTTLAPVTTGAMRANGTLGTLYSNPVYQQFGDYSSWTRASDDQYVQFTINVKLQEIDNNGVAGVVQEARPVYLTDLVILNNASNASNQKRDISSAIRVHIHTESVNMLLSKEGGNTLTYGSLDLNGDGKLDTEEAIYDWTDYDELSAGTYGTNNSVQTAYEIGDVKPTVYSNGKYTENLQYCLGTTKFSKQVTPESGTTLDDTYFEDENLTVPTEDEAADGEKSYYVADVLTVTVTIWLEGWQKLPVTKSKTGAEILAELENLAGAGENPRTTFETEDGYYTDSALETEATGTIDSETTYYYEVSEASWDPDLYLGSMFNVGLVLEADATL